MNAPINALDVIAANVMTGNPQGTRAKHIAEQVLKALSAAGFVVSAPQDLEWGICPGQFGDPSDPQPHYVSLSLCAGCLEYDPQ